MWVINSRKGSAANHTAPRARITEIPSHTQCNNALLDIDDLACVLVAQQFFHLLGEEAGRLYRQLRAVIGVREARIMQLIMPDWMIRSSSGWYR